MALFKLLHELKALFEESATPQEHQPDWLVRNLEIQKGLEENYRDWLVRNSAAAQRTGEPFVEPSFNDWMQGASSGKTPYSQKQLDAQKETILEKRRVDIDDMENVNSPLYSPYRAHNYRIEAEAINNPSTAPERSLLSMSMQERWEVHCDEIGMSPELAEAGMPTEDSGKQRSWQRRPELRGDAERAAAERRSWQQPPMNG